MYKSIYAPNYITNLIRCDACDKKNNANTKFDYDIKMHIAHARNPIIGRITVVNNNNWKLTTIKITIFRLQLNCFYLWTIFFFFFWKCQLKTEINARWFNMKKKKKRLKKSCQRMENIHLNTRNTIQNENNIIIFEEL